jgi:hypothetical protein
MPSIRSCPQDCRPLRLTSTNPIRAAGRSKAPTPPSGRPWGPARRADSPIPPSQAQDTLSPARPTGPGLRWRAQAISTLGQAARQSSQFPKSVPLLAHRPSVPSPNLKHTIRVSTGSVPSGSQALSTPCRHCLLPGLSGLLCSGRPSLFQLTCESLRPRFVLSSESLSATPT